MIDFDDYKGLIKEQVARCLEEDIGRGDITTLAIFGKQEVGSFALVARESCVLSGLNLLEIIFDNSLNCSIDLHYNDGDFVSSNSKLAFIKGPIVSILTRERVMLNYLQFMSGIATCTKRYVEELKATNVKLLDTRKTVPGMRLLSKYAVTCGGGYNHRLRLDTAIMIKDNHISAVGGISKAVELVKASNPGVAVEVECANLHDVQEALDADVEQIMLDNMSLELMQEAVSLINGKSKVEASGGLNLRDLKAVAQLGVDYISVGAITNRSTAVDIALDSLD